jgi:hypothetical protein
LFLIAKPGVQFLVPSREICGARSDTCEVFLLVSFVFPC